MYFRLSAIALYDVFLSLWYLEYWNSDATPLMGKGVLDRDYMVRMYLTEFDRGKSALDTCAWYKFQDHCHSNTSCQPNWTMQ